MGNDALMHASSPFIESEHPLPELVTITEAARAQNCSRNTVERWATKAAVQPSAVLRAGSIKVDLYDAGRLATAVSRRHAAAMVSGTISIARE